MPPAEAGVSVTVKDARGNLHTLRGDTPQDYKNNALALLGALEGEALFASTVAVFRSAITTPVQSATTTLHVAPVPDEAQAVNNVVSAFPGSTVSTVGQPLPQPQAASVGSTPGGELQPGETRMVNGELKKWVPAGVSAKTGKSYKGFWGKP